ncbi:Flp pilus assembly protein RcpC [Citrifermentans bemidjiense Bem]|uniref:Flp pilus assembly protein RcpC n=1 Tax=Citrifermentans bemidjiense (strain ATCC BAA-1014 / DSM 16622 / JCM 12645 / Bem) TaxID=404380 RepID=B5EAZ1_CITBB|nr:Flp pilus assembly protein CpaB [Citrifermentans bemidjiense]ACH38852.1 Flp pilus assembly protein RcpC [Citrifermentans bemidjiense Bem]
MTRPSAMTTVTIIALLLGGLATIMANNYLKKQADKPYEGVPIASAAVDLPLGSKLNATQVKLATWPKDALPAGGYQDYKPLVGRIVVRPLSAGEVITENKLMPLNSSGGIMTYMVPDGHRAVTVSVNEVAGVAGFITPNSRVDVLLTIPRPGSTNERDNISKIILQNVPVLATGQVTEQKEGGKPGVVPTVTLDVTPIEAEKLIVGTKKGSLQLLLRNVIDVASVDTKGATVSRALGGTETLQRALVVRHAPARTKVAAAKPAATPAPAKFTMEVIKGGTKSVREFVQD